MATTTSSKPEQTTEKSCTCNKCNKKISDNRASIFCEGACQSWYHVACVNITKKQMTQIGELGDIIVWLCSSCREEQKNLWKTKNYVEQVYQKLENLEEKLNNISNQNQVHSYADITKHSEKMNRNSTECVSHKKTLIFKPKKQQTREHSMKDIKQKVDPIAAGAPVKYFNATNRGYVIIKSDKPENLDKLLEHSRDKLKRDYEIEVRGQNNPRLKLTGLHDEYRDGDELLDSIKLLNSKIINSQDKMKVTYTRQSKKTGKWTICVETLGHTFKKLVNTQLDMGWNQCQIIEDLNILRCFRCGRFGHKQSNCNCEKVCTYCAGPHDRFKCGKQSVKCVNCSDIKDKFNDQHQCDHDSEDESKCPILAKKCKLARERIDYNAREL